MIERIPIVTVHNDLRITVPVLSVRGFQGRYEATVPDYPPSKSPSS